MKLMKPTAIQSLPHFSQQDISPEVTRFKKGKLHCCLSETPH